MIEAVEVVEVIEEQQRRSLDHLDHPDSLDHLCLASEFTEYLVDASLGGRCRPPAAPAR